MNTLTPRQWKEAVEGFGLEKVPKHLRKELCCHMCGTNHPGSLWTDRPIFNDANVNRVIDALHGNCFCRYHAEQMFGPEEDDTTDLEHLAELVKECEK